MNNSDFQFSSDNWWLNEIPCVHRIYDTLPLDGAHGIQNSLGMTISLKLLNQKLEQLSNHVHESNIGSNSNKKVLVTFDDGHKDVLKTLPMLKKFPNIQPILFITGKQLRGDVQPYPLTALYTWCAAHNKNPNDLKDELGFDRKFLKLQPEEHQRALLSKAGIDLNPRIEQMVNLTDLDTLTKNSWLIGYHGSQHCDLRIHQPHKLKPFFIQDYKLLMDLGYTPWFAWPEGRWNNSLALMAKSVGFNVQFGLRGEKGIDNECSIQKLLGVKITASTVFDQVERVCNDIYPVYQQLFNLASDAEHYYLDDTTHRILEAKPVEKAVRNSDKTRLRSGIYTSGVIATLKDNNSIVLFETNIGHAGEFIDSILHKRSQSCGKPVIMSDALPSNRPTAREATMSLCNSHARRQFVDVINHFPEDVEHVLTRYGEIWVNDDYAKSEQLSPTARLAYHQAHSLPIMEDIKLWGEAHIANETVEENSGLGKAIRYFLKHYVGLSYFCSMKGVKIDNNRIESMLKIIVRDRKNAMFHKTLLGATIGDVVTSVIATASEAGINVFDYFTTLQQESGQVKAHPENYLPWNYITKS